MQTFRQVETKDKADPHVSSSFGDHYQKDNIVAFMVLDHCLPICQHGTWSPTDTTSTRKFATSKDESEVVNQFGKEPHSASAIDGGSNG